MVSRIIKVRPESEPSGGIGARVLVIGGIAYDNSAAKFWSGLVDEILADFPGGDGVIIEGLTDGLLDPAVLYPEDLLQRHIDGLGRSDPKDAMQDALAELEITGPPGTITAKVLTGEDESAAYELPTDCVDTEIYPFLLAWLLEWAGLAEFAWNEEIVRGRFRAEDAERAFIYRIHFALETAHLSEGLFRRVVTLRFERVCVGSAGLAGVS